MDGDGDLDLTSAGVHSDVLLWHENDGKGNLVPRKICEHEPGFLERHACGDLNGDGRPDVVIVKNRIGHVLWFENNGHPADGKLWKRHVITTSFMRAYDVALADLDADGDLDVGGSAYTGDRFAWFENPGPDGLSQEWKQHVFDKDKIANTRTIIPADINRDGKIDLLGTATYGHLTLWYENTGEPGERRFRRHLIDSQNQMPSHGQPVDIDHDGDLDVVMAFGMRGGNQETIGQVAWYENAGQTGTGSAWKKHVIGKLLFGFESVTGDLDGDGDLDVIATGCSGGQPNTGEVCWFENGGDPKGEWKKHLLKHYSGAAQVIVMDLDKDGRLDIAASSEEGTFYWWKNRIQP